VQINQYSGAKMRLLATILTSLTLIACGGGGGDAAAPDAPISNSLTVTGTTATGLAISGATVTGKCKVGTGTATTLANGTFTLTVTDGQLPCVLQVTNPADGTKLHTLVLGTSSTAIANITPLTEMTTARVLGSEPNVFFAAFDAATVTQKVTTTNIATAQTEIDLVFTGTIDTTIIGDFITTPLVAATQGSPTSGDAQDKLLDALKLKLTTAQLGTVTTALAGNQTVDAIKQTVITMTAAPTTPPVANAGAAQSVVTGTTVTLDATASSAATGKSLTFAWTLTSKPAGSTATLATPTTAKPTFVVDVAGTYVASVIVNDGTTASSAVAVTVTASVANAAPVANAGVAQNIVAGSVVTLDGSASSDANSDALTYAWTLTSKPAGSSAALSSSTSAKPTFTADAAGTYVASLTVNDGKVSSTAVTVSVTAAVANVAPVANAGVAQNIVAGSVVTLDGSTSSDANSDALTYAWTLTSKPAGSSAELSSSTSAKPTFTADVAGTYVCTLTVNDGKVNSTAVTVSITAAVANVAPVANAGVAQNVAAGSTVTLDGSVSSDANSDPLTYAWTLTSKPAGSTAALSSATAAKPTFTADVAGTYVASLTVNDGKVSSTTATVSITAAVLNVAPVANAGVAQNVFAGNVVTLDGSASSDANSDALTYAWTLTSKPAGSSAALSSLTSAKPTFTADVAGTYVASLTVSDGKVSSTSSTVTVTATLSTATTVTSFGPTLGPVGQWVYVYGTNFVAGQTTVTMGGVASIATNVYDSNSLGFTVPSGAVGTTSIVVTSPNGSATSTQTFTVGAPTGAPTLSQITVELGPIGQLVGVYGSNFISGQTTVAVGGVSSIVANVGSPDYLQFTVPNGATGTTHIVVTTPSGNATSTQTFTVGVPTGAPTVTSISPTVGSAGQTVYVYGTNFVGGQTTVTMGGTSLISTVVYSPSSLGFTVPTGATGTTSIIVTTPNGVATSAQTYAVQ
jgi:hypothetical protein